jgi:hypothetical protein
MYHLATVAPAGQSPRQSKDVGEAFSCAGRLYDLDSYPFLHDNVPAAFRHSGKFRRGDAFMSSGFRQTLGHGRQDTYTGKYGGIVHGCTYSCCN